MCHYGWTDLIEGLCTFALCHWDGNPRPVVDICSNISRTFSRLTPVENPPDAVLLISEARLEFSRAKWDSLAIYRAVCNALAWHGVNFSVLPESERARVPASVKLTICSDEFKDAKFVDPVDGVAALRKAIGERIRAAGVTSTRLAGDPDTLETYRVPGKGATAWLFWNGDEKRPVTVEREMLVSRHGKFHGRKRSAVEEDGGRWRTVYASKWFTRTAYSPTRNRVGTDPSEGRFCARHF